MRPRAVVRTVIRSCCKNIGGTAVEIELGTRLRDDSSYGQSRLGGEGPELEAPALSC